MTALAEVTPLRAAKESPAGYMSPEQVCELVPGMTVENLKELRKKGKGPRYSKPTGPLGHVVIYRRADVIAWVEGAFQSTREQA